MDDKTFELEESYLERLISECELTGVSYTDAYEAFASKLSILEEEHKEKYNFNIPFAERKRQLELAYIHATSVVYNPNIDYNR